MVETEKLCCIGCGSCVRSHTRSGYCAKCFHANVNEVKTKYNAARWESGTAKKTHWAFRGVIISDVEIENFNAAENCGICDASFSEQKKCLDHCHETGVYRGALCVQCNAALGKLGDDLDLIVERIQRYKESRTL